MSRSGGASIIYLLSVCLVIGSSCKKNPVSAPSAPPTVAIISPVSGQLITGPTPIVADVVGDDTIIAVEFFVDRTFVGVDSVPSYSVLWNPEPWADGGEHRLHAKATDARGQGAESRYVYVTVQAKTSGSTGRPFAMPEETKNPAL